MVNWRENKYLKHIWPISFLLGLLVGLVFIIASLAAITTDWGFFDELNYEVSDEDDLKVIGGQVLMDDVKEFQVNELVNGIESSARIDSLSNGNFVVVWESPDTSGSDSDNSHIAAKVIDSSGVTVVPEFQLNDQETGKQYFPYVEVLSNDNIFVTWQSQAIGFGTDNSQSLVSAKIIDATGSTVIPEFQVNEETSGLQGLPAAVEMNDGNIFIVWSSASTSISPTVGDDNSGGYVAGKIVDEFGGNVTGEFQINEEIENIQSSGELSLLSNGNVLVTWYSADTNNAFIDDSLTYAAAKVYDVNGGVVIPEFQINEEIENDQFNISSESLSNGNVVVTWSSSDVNNAFTDNSEFYIAAKVYDADMNVVVAEKQVNQEIESHQRFSELVELDNGNIFVAWSSYDTDHSGDDNQIPYVAGIILDDELNVVRNEFQVNDGIASFQAQPALGVSRDDGNVLTTFLSFDFTYADTDNSSGFLAGKIYQANGNEFYPDDSPWVSLVDGYDYLEAIRMMDVDLATDGSVSLQISNDEGLTWYYYDGSDWVVTVEGVDESNSVQVVNDNLADFYNLLGAGSFNWKLFLTGDGTFSVAVNSLSIQENEVPVIGNGDASISVEVFDNEEFVVSLEAVDPEDDEVLFSVSGGADSGLFEITEDGLLSIALEAEREQTYEVVVRATDEFYGYTEQTVNVDVLRPIFRSGSSSSSSSSSSPFNKSVEESEVDSDGGLDEVDLASEESDESLYKLTKTREKSVTEKGEYCVFDFENEVKNKMQGLSRMEAVRLFIDFMCIDVLESETLLIFNDTSELSDLDKKYLRTAYDLRLIEGYLDGSFRPDKILNYAELSALFYRSLESEILESNPWYVDYVKFAPVVEESRLLEAVSVSKFIGKFKNFYGF